MVLTYGPSDDVPGGRAYARGREKRTCSTQSILSLRRLFNGGSRSLVMRTCSPAGRSTTPSAPNIARMGRWFRAGVGAEDCRTRSTTWQAVPGYVGKLREKGNKPATINKAVRYLTAADMDVLRKLHVQTQQQGGPFADWNY